MTLKTGADADNTEINYILKYIKINIMKIFVIPVIPDSYSIILTYNLTIDISRPKKVNKSWIKKIYEICMFCSSVYFICIYKFKYFLIIYFLIKTNQVKFKESNWSMYCTGSNICESHRWRSLNVLPSHWRPDPSAVPCCPLPVNTQHYYSTLNSPGRYLPAQANKDCFRTNITP